MAPQCDKNAFGGLLLQLPPCWTAPEQNTDSHSAPGLLMCWHCLTIVVGTIAVQISGDMNLCFPEISWTGISLCSVNYAIKIPHISLKYMLLKQYSFWDVHCFAFANCNCLFILKYALLSCFTSDCKWLLVLTWEHFVTFTGTERSSVSRWNGSCTRGP